MIGSPSEGGQKQFDNKVNNPATVQFTPRETMRGKMALLGYLYGIRP